MSSRPQAPETYPDIPRPGDADFTSFPKTLAEDTIHYSVHVIPSSSTTSTATIRSRLLSIQKAATKLTKELLSEYIWQRESFSLQISSSDTKEAPCLSGSTSFGDSIADEWLIVYLLRELSKQFEDAWIRVHDADGEFLLVEAANVLPKWLNPEVAEHRVWIHGGQLRIIPRQLKHSNLKVGKTLPREMSLQHALDFIASSANELIHSPIMEEEAFFRLRNYPAQIEESLHRARVTIPRRLAHILHRTPQHISPAIEAFYLRDPISLRPLQAKDPTNLRFPPKDFVTTSVKFTRVGYAQLKSQDFPPPPSWANVWPRTGMHDAKVLTSRESGMKLSCAFEMLVADPQNRDKRAVREIEMLLEDLESGEEELPSDAEIAKWPHSQEEDDEAWLDVNFQDFERDISERMKNGSTGGKGAKGNTGTGDFGFSGDKGAQDNLRRMVERFEQFLNDDDAGAEGAELDDDDEYDEMDDDDDDESDDNDGEDRDASFDEEEFEKMMKQMMGLPLDDQDEGTSSRIQELDDSDDEEDQGEDLKKVMARMEAELKESGALNLEPAAQNGRKQLKSKERPTTDSEDDDEEERQEDMDDEQYQLAKNILEAFKGQGGMAGPAGNMLRSMGIQLPRDEKDKDE